MKKTAFLFPGQGSQHIGMGKDFYEQYKVSRITYEEASDIVSIDLAKLCFEENNKLNKTEFTQIALFVTEVAMLRALQSEGIISDVNVGLSLGEYSALMASGIMDFVDACNIVRQRGILMEQAVPTGVGAMAAVVGLSEEVIEAVLENFKQVQIANYNCPGQIVISGIAEEVDSAGSILKEKGAKRVLRLNVSGPFHSFMLTEAGEKLEKELEQIVLHDVKIPYVANCTAGYVRNSNEIRELLKKQVYSPVKFEQSIRLLLQDGVQRFIEIGPGKTLSGFLKKVNKEVEILSISSVEELRNLILLI